MKRKLSILLVGIGGYGLNYLNALIGTHGNEEWELLGAVDPYPLKCPKYNDLLMLGIPVYPSMDDFYNVSAADLAIISSPIQYHAEQTCKALSFGSHVLCEKPAAATIQDISKMKEASDKSRKFIAIGYQWSFSDAVLRLKHDILEGKLGRPLRMKTIVLWPRGKDYYARAWAGKKKDSMGRWVLDSVASNAAAHYLHNMFFVIGDAEDQSACLVSVMAETYKANPIENYDTSVIRAYTDKGVEILFIASHAIPIVDRHEPEFEYVFENAVVRYKTLPQGEKASITAVLNDGTVIDYGSPNANGLKKLWKVIEAIRQGCMVPCGLEAASTHTVCINIVQEINPEPVVFPNNLICMDDINKITWVKGLGECLERCYTGWKMPHETGAAWAYIGDTKTLCE